MNFEQIKNIKNLILQNQNIDKEIFYQLLQTKNIELLCYSANQVRSTFCSNKYRINLPIVLGEPNEVDIDRFLEKLSSLKKKKLDNIVFIHTNSNILDYSELLEQIKNNINVGMNIELRDFASFQNTQKATYQQIQKEIITFKSLGFNIVTFDNINYKQNYIENLSKICKEQEIELSAVLYYSIFFNKDNVFCTKKFIDTALEYKKYNLKYITISFNDEKFDTQNVISAISVLRLINPDTIISVSGIHNLKHIKNEIFKSGINSILLDRMYANYLEFNYKDILLSMYKEGFEI